MPARPGIRIIYLQEKLESVQKRSARFITSNYRDYEPGSMTKRLKDLDLQPLKERRKQHRLILLCKGLNSRANLPLDQLCRPIRYTKNMHNEHFNRILARTDVLKFSFIPNTICDWDSLPPDLIHKYQTATNDPVSVFIHQIRGGTKSE